MPFDKNLFGGMFGGKNHTFELTSPNGGYYRYTTNTLTDEEITSFTAKFDLAISSKDQVLFDQVWKELIQTEEKESPIESQFKKIQDEFGKILKNGPTIFGGTNVFGDLNKEDLFGNLKEKMPSFKNDKDLTIEEIDEKIKVLTEIKEEKLKLKTEEQNKARISELKANLDKKLLDLSGVEDAEEKAKITEELTAIYKEIQELEGK